MNHILAKKLVFILAMHSAAMFDGWRTNAYLDAGMRPKAGEFYIAGDGLRHLSHGSVTYEADPLIGQHPGHARVWFQVNGDALFTDWLILKNKPVGRKAAKAIIAEHLALGTLNWVRDPKRVKVLAIENGQGDYNAWKMAATQRSEDPGARSAAKADYGLSHE